MLEPLIPGYAYKWVYVIFTWLLLVCYSFKKGKSLTVKEQENRGFYIAIGIGVILMLFFGLRPIDDEYMGDTVMFSYRFQEIAKGIQPPLDASLSTFHDPLWRVIENAMALARIDVTFWLLLIAVAYISFNLLAVRRVFRGYELPAFLFFISSFMFYSGGVNAFRNACAYSVMFYALTYYSLQRNEKYLWMALFALIAIMIHASTLMILVGIVGALVLRRTRYALIPWVLAIIISLVWGSSFAYMIAGVVKGRALLYLQFAQDESVMSEMASTGFRWDFLLFSLPPIILGYYVTEIRKVDDKFFQLLLNTYILTNAIWIIFIDAYASNRFASLSWSLYPYVIAYPVMKMKLWEPKVQNLAALGALWIIFAENIFFLK